MFFLQNLIFFIDLVINGFYFIDLVIYGSGKYGLDISEIWRVNEVSDLEEKEGRTVEHVQTTVSVVIVEVIGCPWQSG